MRGEVQVPCGGPASGRLARFEAQLGARQAVGGGGKEPCAKPTLVERAPGRLRAWRAHQHANAEARRTARVAPHINPERWRSGEADAFQRVGEVAEPVAPRAGGPGLLRLEQLPITDGGRIGHRAG